jgi:hypothetical protein
MPFQKKLNTLYHLKDGSTLLGYKLKSFLYVSPLKKRMCRLLSRIRTDIRHYIYQLFFFNRNLDPFVENLLKLDTEIVQNM